MITYQFITVEGKRLHSLIDATFPVPRIGERVNISSTRYIVKDVSHTYEEDYDKDSLHVIIYLLEQSQPTPYEH